MKTVAFALAAAAFAAMAAFAPAANAQISENGGPVSYSADNLQYFFCDGGLSFFIIGQPEISKNVLGIFSGIVHSGHSCTMLGGI